MKKSKTNLERRQREVEERIKGRWQPDWEQPVLEADKVHYEVSERIKAINWGGLGLLQTTVARLGLAQAIDHSLKLLKRHKPYHESDHVLSLMYNVLCGGQCLENLETLRQDLGFLKALGAQRIPDPTTAGDFLRRFCEQDVFDLMDALNRVRAKVWRRQNRDRRMRTNLSMEQPSRCGNVMAEKDEPDDSSKILHITNAF